MYTYQSLIIFLLAALGGAGVTLAQTQTQAQTQEPVLAAAEREKGALLETLRELVSIDSGSKDLEGLARMAELISTRLKALGGEVELVDVNVGMERLEDTPERVGQAVRGVFRGSGTRKILLIAHMDTVYLRGMAERQPFRVEGNRAYGLGIADDKQGIAMILHTLAMLKNLGSTEYGQITVLINGDEEISSPGSRKLLTALGAEHDVTLSFEASRVESDKLALATAGIGSITLRVKGKASHAGSAPEQGVNALYEMAHQVLQTRDLSQPEIGLKLNWTLAQGGQTRNVIPPEAEAQADVRVLRVADYDKIEQTMRERIKNKLLPDTEVTMLFERRRPPLEASEASVALARRAQGIYRELGKELVADSVAEGGGTDAAFAALATRNAVLERMGVQGYGIHTQLAEYIYVDNIVPRLYLAARLIMDVSRGQTAVGAP